MFSAGIFSFETQLLLEPLAIASEMCTNHLIPTYIGAFSLRRGGRPQFTWSRFLSVSSTGTSELLLKRFAKY
jgi:hypothetical protein